jgi:sec-independent protein translocase protein TatC
MLKKQPADDLFEKSSMTFGEHLEELRKTLGKAFIWLGVGTCIGLFFAENIVRFIESPLKAAIYDFYIARAKAQFKDANGKEPSDELASWMSGNGMMPERVFVDPAALKQLPESLAMSSPDKTPPETEKTASQEAKPKVEPVATVSSADFNPWKNVDIEKLERLKPFLLWRPIPNKLVTLTATEPFMIWMKAGLVAGVIIGSPGIFWHIWQFFAAGLYPHERRYVYWYLPLSLLLFFAGVSLAFFVVFRLVLGFLMTYNTGLDVEFTPRLNDYMSFALFLPLGFGIAFQLPIVMLGLHRFGLVTVETFSSQWRIAVLAIAFLSMILTPAEVYSMIGLFLPLTGLYFFGIFLCKYMPKGAGIGSAALDPR